MKLENVQHIGLKQAVPLKADVLHFYLASQSFKFHYHLANCWQVFADKLASSTQTEQL